MKPLRKLHIMNGDKPAYALYEQAVYWESLRAHYHATHDNLEAAVDASDRTAAYREALDTFPERGHLYVAPQSDRRWS